MIEKINKLMAILTRVFDVLKFFVTGYAKTVEKTEEISGKMITVARILIVSILTCGIGFAVYKMIQSVKSRKSMKAIETTVNNNPENMNLDYQYVVMNEDTNDA